MIEYILNNFSECFVNEEPKKCLVDLNTYKSKFNKIKTSSKVSKILCAFAGACLPVGMITYPFSQKAVAYLSVAAISTMALAYGLNRYAKYLYEKTIYDNSAMDYINYCIYKQNEALVEMVESYKKNTPKQQEEKKLLIKANLKELLETQDAALDQIKRTSDYFESVVDNYENLHDFIKERDFELIKNYNVCDYINTHITQNAPIYRFFAPEYDQSIVDSIKCFKEVEKIQAKFPSEEYINERIRVDYMQPLTKNFEKVIEE